MAINPLRTAPDQNRNATLDILRGIAILGVIIVHCSISFPVNPKLINAVLNNGKYGVQLFFFISAYTMCMMWERHSYDYAPIRNFYIRRIFRILPMFWLAIPFYLWWYAGVASSFAPNGIQLHHLVLTTTFLHGLWPDTFNSVVPGGWSISVEVLFYLVFPILIMTVGKSHNRYLYLALSLIFMYPFFEPKIQNSFSQYYPDSLLKDFVHFHFIRQLPIFLLGIWIYYKARDKLLEVVLIVGVIVTLATVLAYFKLETGNDLKFAVAVAFLTTCVYGATRTELLSNKNRSVPWLSRLGTKSYGMYLVHFAIVDVLRRSLEKIPDHIFPQIVKLPVAIVSVALVSYLLSVQIELAVNFVFNPIKTKLLDFGQPKPDGENHRLN